jgi:hypothetical protein
LLILTLSRLAPACPLLAHSTLEAVTFASLLMQAGMRKSDIKQGVLDRARLSFGHLVMQALAEHAPSVARDAYAHAESLPSYATVGELSVKGYRLDGALFGGDFVEC